MRSRGGVMMEMKKGRRDRKRVGEGEGDKWREEHRARGVGR